MRRGEKAEKRVGAHLRRNGARVTMSPGSRTSADLIAEWSTGRTWLVQVKSTSRQKPHPVTAKERQALIRRAKRSGATPVIAQVTRDRIAYFSAVTGRELHPKPRR